LTSNSPIQWIEPFDEHPRQRCTAFIRGRQGGDAMPIGFTHGSRRMRKTLSFGIAAMLAAVVITALAMAATRSQKKLDATAAGIDVFKLMTNAPKLQVQQYDAF
jgi:hypothetical protein